MGRQHTIYLSDKTYQEMESLKKEGESMSNVIRTAVQIAYLNIDNYDLVRHQQMKIDALRRQIQFVKEKVEECGVHTNLWQSLYDAGVID